MNNSAIVPLVTIDSLALSGVVGGEDPGIFANGAGPNRFSATGQVKGSGYGITVEGQGGVQIARTNYGACLDAATTAEARAACGRQFGAADQPVTPGSR